MALIDFHGWRQLAGRYDHHFRHRHHRWSQQSPQPLQSQYVMLRYHYEVSPTIQLEWRRDGSARVQAQRRCWRPLQQVTLGPKQPTGSDKARPGRHRAPPPPPRVLLVAVATKAGRRTAGFIINSTVSLTGGDLSSAMSYPIPIHTT